MQKAQGVFEFTRWEEASYSEPDGGLKLTEARVSNDFQGDIVGSSDLVYVMSYLTEDTGTFVGYEQVTGRLSDRDGTFVLRHDGTFTDGSVRAALNVVAGSGTGALAGLAGEGEYVATHGQKQSPYTLRWRIGGPAAVDA
jgi:Protein of unknown function (DUF3224)